MSRARSESPPPVWGRPSNGDRNHVASRMPSGSNRNAQHEVAGIHPGGVAQHARQRDHAAAVVLPRRPGGLAHRVLQHEAHPVAARVVEGLEIRSGVGILAPVEPAAHLQKVPHAERVLARIRAPQVRIARKQAQHRRLDRGQPPLIVRDADQQ
jgi:hypothetical protein